MTEEQQKQYDEWFNTRPKVVQDLILKYPFDKSYKMKEDAPYSLSCGGTKVSINSYMENGNIGVVVMAEDKMAEAKLHEMELCAQYGRDYDEITKQNVKVEINPIYLEQIN
jgi:hypothetical protein